MTGKTDYFIYDINRSYSELIKEFLRRLIPAGIVILIVFIFGDPSAADTEWWFGFEILFTFAWIFIGIWTLVWTLGFLIIIIRKFFNRRKETILGIILLILIILLLLYAQTKVID